MDTFIKLLPGVLAGMSEAVVTAPFELAKTLMQTGNEQQRKSNMITIFKTTLKSEHGIRGLYYGLPAQLLQSGGKVGIRFASFNKIKEKLSEVPSTFVKFNPSTIDFLSGFGAGCMESILWITPCERLKVVRQTQIGRGMQEHTSIASSVRMLVKEQGVMNGLFRGLWPTVIRNGFSVGARFVIVQSAVSRVEKPSGYHHAIAGFFSGFVTTILNNPIDVIKSRVQADQQGGKDSIRKYKNSFDCLVSIYRNEGLMVLFKSGLSARIWKISIGQGVIFFAHQQFTKLLSTR